MAEFLLELLSEEIPAGMQEETLPYLRSAVIDILDETEFTLGTIDTFSTPRRLVLFMEVKPDIEFVRQEERRGPRVDAPQQALDGFLQSCGKAKEDLIENNGYYFVLINHKSRTVEDVLEEKLPKIISKFPWSKSMLWGDGDFRWVRPLHSILAIFNKKHLDFEVGGIKSTLDSSVNNFDDYRANLKKIGIILENDTYEHERFVKIGNDAQDLCHKKGLKLVEDNSLMNNITGLVESPFCIMGKIDKKFLDLPNEVLQISMETHQKFLSVENPKTSRIENFITFADKHNPTKEAVDTIRKGNERVLSARLADAKFFWENDLRIAKAGMKPWADKLQQMTFHNKLGTQAERVNRIAEFAKAHAGFFKVKPDDAEITAKIMKLDLCSDMVKEFPELQGVMAGYYANESGYFGGIGFACREHYAPLGQHDSPPAAPLSILMALADKLDMLAGFWSVGITPTGSKDPFALRRAALGVIRIILRNNLRLSLTDLLDTAFKPFANKAEPDAQDKLMDFFHERLKIYLGSRIGKIINSNTIDACRFGDGEQDITLLYNRAEALKEFYKTDDGKNLLQGFKRAHNILHAEQKKDGVFYEMPPEPQYFQDPTETELHTALNAAEHALPPLMQKEQFAQMLQTLANLRAPIDAFFTQVQVNSDQSAVRRNRLCLLHKLCSVMKTFADFSRLNG